MRGNKAVNVDNGLYEKLKLKARREGKIIYRLVEEILADAIGYTFPLTDENEAAEAKKTEEKQLEEMSV